MIFMLQTRHDVNLGIAGWNRTPVNWATRVQSQALSD